MLLIFCAGCVQQTGSPLEGSSHFERVLQDVSAMIEGMTAAHTENRVVLRGPEYRSSAPRTPD